MDYSQLFSIRDKKIIEKNLLENENNAENEGKQSEMALHYYNHINDVMVVNINNVLLEVIDFKEQQQTHYDYCYINDIFYWLKLKNYTRIYAHLPDSFTQTILSSFKALTVNKDMDAYINQIQNLKFIDDL